jgi:hypothetical protein
MKNVDEHIIHQNFRQKHLPITQNCKKIMAKSKSKPLLCVEREARIQYDRDVLEY